MRARTLPPTWSVALACLLLTGCSSEEPTDSPTPRHRAQCVVSDPQGEVILHSGSLTARAGLTLDDATLEEAVNLDVVERAVVQFTGRAGVQGIVLDYPPLKTAGLADSLARWEDRRALPGLTLGPDDGQQAVLVAVRLHDPATPGHLVGVRLTTDAGVRVYAQPVLVKPPGEICTVADYDGTLDWVP
ncbi:hypothetical protein [Nocardioides rubriscoriae]|uniref:hypothetical protein n=1 Tax=Nocardioides rubriscoriae TaxID=642762 RepID=UPI0011DF8279|nr:hypothetical protein [Nocardioides rubriscoriae]